MKRRNKWSRTGSERGTSMDQMIEKLGGSGGGARRVSRKAKTNVSKTGKADSTASGARDAEAEGLYGDWLKMSPKNKNFIKRVDKASRKNMKKMMKSPDYGKKFTFSKKLKKMVGLE